MTARGMKQETRNEDDGGIGMSFNWPLSKRYYFLSKFIERVQ